MTAFPPALLADLQRLPGASHSFLKQLAGEDAVLLRTELNAVVSAAPDGVAMRWRDRLRSLDNRRFFQAMAEVMAVRTLMETGWTLTPARHGEHLVLSREGDELILMTLAFLRQTRAGPDGEVIDKLTRALDRVGSRSRIAMHVRRWLPHDFDPEPVRRAIDLWLREVDRGGWDGRYAAYEDEHVALEFALTGEKAEGGAPVVAFALPPHEAHKVREVVEKRLVFELDRHVAAGGESRPVFVACVSNEAWPLSRGHLRELLLGKPGSQELVGEPPRMKMRFSRSYAPAIFRDPVYDLVAGMGIWSRPDSQSARLGGPTYVAPWSIWPCPEAALPRPLCHVLEREANEATLTWTR